MASPGPAAQRGFGYAVLTFAVLWLALAGVCSVVTVSHAEDLENVISALGMLLATSPISFGPPLIALLLARSSLQRAKAEAGKRPKPNPMKGGFRIAIGIAMAAIGLLFCVTIASVAFNTFSDPQIGFFNPLYGGIAVVHVGLVAILMVIGGAWLAITGARDSGLWRSDV